MKKFLFIPVLSLALIGCNQHEEPKKSHNEQDIEQYQPDNTGRNMRDRNSMHLTPGNQSESAQDVQITKQIRQALIADKSLSTNAKNIKVMTINGVVTLRGPVLNATEREAILNKLKSMQGVLRVENQLEVTN